jgi:hypothetical protein
MWLSFSLHLGSGTVVKCEDIDAHEPATQRPDAVNAGGLGKRLEDG